MSEPAGYLFSVTDGQYRTYGTFRLPGYPDWWTERGLRGIVVAPLSSDELAHPLLDIVAKHAHRLGLET